MLEAGEDGMVAGGAQGVEDVPGVIVHARSRGGRGPSIPLRWGHWPVRRAARLGEQVGAALKARRKRTAFGGEALEVRGGDGMAVGLEITAGIVGVEVEDVGFGGLG